MDYSLKMVCGAIASLFTFLFGNLDAWLYALIVVVIADFMTGLIKAYILEDISSKTGFKGILKKVLYFSVVCVAVIIEQITGVDGLIRNAVIGFLIANEGISILENCSSCGLPIPKILLNKLQQIRDDNE